MLIHCHWPTHTPSWLTSAVSAVQLPLWLAVADTSLGISGKEMSLAFMPWWRLYVEMRRREASSIKFNKMWLILTLWVLIWVQVKPFLTTRLACQANICNRAHPADPASGFYSCSHSLCLDSWVRKAFLKTLRSNLRKKTVWSWFLEIL